MGTLGDKSNKSLIDWSGIRSKQVDSERDSDVYHIEIDLFHHDIAGAADIAASPRANFSAGFHEGDNHYGYIEITAEQRERMENNVRNGVQDPALGYLLQTGFVELDPRLQHAILQKEWNADQDPELAPERLVGEDDPQIQAVIERLKKQWDPKNDPEFADRSGDPFLQQGTVAARKKSSHAETGGDAVVAVDWSPVRDNTENLGKDETGTYRIDITQYDQMLIQEARLLSERPENFFDVEPDGPRVYIEITADQRDRIQDYLSTAVAPDPAIHFLIEGDHLTLYAVEADRDEFAHINLSDFGVDEDEVTPEKRTDSVPPAPEEVDSQPAPPPPPPPAAAPAVAVTEPAHASVPGAQPTPAFRELWNEIRDNNLNAGRGDDDSYHIDISHYDPDLIGEAKDIASSDGAYFSVDAVTIGGNTHAYIEITPEQRRMMEENLLNNHAPDPALRFLADTGNVNLKTPAIEHAVHNLGAGMDDSELWEDWTVLWKKLKDDELNSKKGMFDDIHIDISNADPALIAEAKEIADQPGANFNLSVGSIGSTPQVLLEIEPRQRQRMEDHCNITGSPDPAMKFLLDNGDSLLDPKKGKDRSIPAGTMQFLASTAAGFAGYTATKTVIGCLLTTTGLTSVAAAAVASGVIASGIIGIGKTWFSERADAAERVEQMTQSGNYSPDQIAQAAKIDYGKVFKEGFKRSVKTGVIAGLTGGLLGGVIDYFNPSDIIENCADAHAPPIAGDGIVDAAEDKGGVCTEATGNGPFGPFTDEIDVVADDCEPCQVPDAPCDFTAIDAETAQIEQVLSMLCPEDILMDGQMSPEEQARLLERYGIEVQLNDSGELVASTEQLEEFYRQNVTDIQTEFSRLVEFDTELEAKLRAAGIDLDNFDDGVAASGTAEAFRIAGEHLGIDMSIDHPCDEVTYDWGQTQEVLQQLGDHVGYEAHTFDPDCVDLETEQPCVEAGDNGLPDEFYEYGAEHPEVIDAVTHRADPLYGEHPEVMDLVTRNPEEISDYGAEHPEVIDAENPDHTDLSTYQVPAPPQPYEEFSLPEDQFPTDVPGDHPSPSDIPSSGYVINEDYSQPEFSDVNETANHPEAIDITTDPPADVVIEAPVSGSGYTDVTAVNGIDYGAAAVCTTTEIETPSTSVRSATCVQLSGKWVDVVSATNVGEHSR